MGAARRDVAIRPVQMSANIDTHSKQATHEVPLFTFSPVKHESPQCGIGRNEESGIRREVAATRQRGEGAGRRRGGGRK